MTASGAKKRSLQDSKNKYKDVVDAVDAIDEKKPAAAAESKAAPPGTPSSTPSSSPRGRNACVIGIYRRLYVFRQVLRTIDPKISAVQDRLLASIGYPAKLIAFLVGSSKLAALSGAISDFRTFNRMVNTPHTIEWALDLLLDNKNPDTLDRWGDYVQAVCGVFYQVLEDLAYLGGKGVLPLSTARQNDLWVVSCMFWAVHVVIEILRAPYYRYVLRRPVNLRNLFVNVAWAPLTYHWSTYTGVFNEGWVGLLGTLACWPNLVYQWKNA